MKLATKVVFLLLLLSVVAAAKRRDPLTEAESWPLTFSSRITRITPAPIAVPRGSLDSLGVSNHTMCV